MSSSSEIALSIDLFKQIPLHRYVNDFTFIVGSSLYDCPRIVADFLSPRICQLHSIDATANEFLIQTKDANREFANIIQLGLGQTVVVPDSAHVLYRSICAELANQEVIALLSKRVEGPFTISTALRRLQLLQDLDADFGSALEFVASHFGEFSPADFQDLDVPILHEILSHPKLKLRSEDSLLELILIQAYSHDDAFSLLEYIQFENLSRSSIEPLLDFISSSFDRFSVALWLKLKPRLLSTSSSPASVIAPTPISVSCPYRDDSPFDGIISHLTHKFTGNVHKLGVVDVTSSSGSYGWYLPHNAVDLYGNTWFASSDKPNSWLCYDFVDMFVTPTHYSIRFAAGASYSSEAKGHYLQSWAIEGSNDGSTWVLLDQQTSSKQIDSPFGTFAVSADKSYRQIRLRQTDRNAFKTHELCLSALEIFGTVDGTATPGIFASLRRRAGQNIHDRGIVEVTASSKRETRSNPRVVVDELEGNQGFVTKDLPDSWVCVRFVDGVVKPTAYRIRTGYFVFNNWIIEGSNDGESWIEFDRRETQDLSVYTTVKHQVANSLQVRMIRIRQTGLNGSGNRDMAIAGLEVFGTLIEGK
jgi:hypothetical protein